MDPELLAKIMQMLGRLEEGQKHSSESRGRLYEKLEKIEGDIAIVGQVASHARDKAEAIGEVVAKDVKPATDDFKRMRAIGFVGLSLLGFAFTALGITLATVGEGVVTTIRAWLRIQ